jgi:hypothetical protein
MTTCSRKATRRDLNSLLGKLLRLDVDHEQPPLAYSIPPGNPFLGRSGTRAEVWAFATTGSA